MSKWIVISAHGQWVPNETFIVPQGMTLRFFSHHGVFIKVNEEKIDGPAVAKKEPGQNLVVEELTDGQTCHEYLLSYPDGVNPTGGAGTTQGYLYKVQKGTNILFSELLKLNRVKQCDVVYLYACRSAPRRQFTGDITKEGIERLKKKMARESAARIAAEDIALFSENRMAWALKHLDEL